MIVSRVIPFIESTPQDGQMFPASVDRRANANLWLGSWRSRRRSLCLTLTPRTKPPHPETVMCRLEPEFARHLILQSFDLSRKKFDHLATLSADHVVMMFVIVMMFVVCLVVTESNFAGKAGLGKEFESSVNRRQANGWVVLLDKAIEILAGKVIFGTKENVEYQLSLPRTPQPGSLDMLVEDRLFYLESVLFRAQFNPPCTGSILPFQF